MVTQQLKDGLMPKEKKRLETRFASTSCVGSQKELSTSIPLMGDSYSEADPINLCRAICIVFERWQRDGLLPGSDRKLNSTRKYRPLLIKEIVVEWCAMSGESDDDRFPYHPDYVVRKWIDFRKMPRHFKTAWIEAARSSSH